MTINDGLQQIFENYIRSIGGKNIESEDKKDSFIGIGFDLDIHGQTIPLSVKYVDQKRWLLLPTVSVAQCNLPALDHVGNNGLICVTDHQGEMFDSGDLFGLFKYVVDTAIDILTTSLKSYQAGNRIALYEEIDGYNQTIMSDAPVIVATHDPTQSDSLYAWCINCTRQRNTPQFYHIKYLVDGASKHPPSSSPYTAIKVTKISLPRIEDFVIPNLFESFDENWWKQQTSKFSKNQLNSLQKKSNFKIVLLEIPTPKMHTYLVISYYQDMTSNKYRNFKAQTLQRGWREYLLNRTGVESQFSSKKTVVIAGCGSVGSRVAEILVESDIDKLILVDYDDMKTDNVMRHYLGIQDVNQSKVSALRNRLQQNIPELEIVAYKTNILNWLISQNSEQLSEIHSIVLATGHPPTELEVCRRLYTYDTSVHVASGWLEAYGLGGHVLGFKSNNDACLKCLYYDDDGNSSNYIKTSLFSNSSGIVLSKNITGCAGAFTAYASVHAMKTAVIIAEFVIELKTGLQSWCATNKLPIDYGLEATKYHDKALQNGGYYSQSLSSIKVAGCSCCST
ncbi:ThiF family adenylyltransferase [Moraxella osloensis]|jgi:molybdopterin/thiamine biosynthesis adenylyltransferase|uniref:ThiF family adenylyltransferase n=1 Tax=Moraxella sp. CTOTU49803 TaxID=2953840 RepID=UPI0024C33610|nr:MULTISPECIES: ThiF family adenylyltransferase [Moraxella]MDK1671184.1 ThiF family adenylyltransferase [Moraxella osloensis]